MMSRSDHLNNRISVTNSSYFHISKKFQKRHLLRTSKTSSNELRGPSYSTQLPTISLSEIRSIPIQIRYLWRNQPLLSAMVDQHLEDIHLTSKHKIMKYLSKILIYLESLECIERQSIKSHLTNCNCLTRLSQILLLNLHLEDQVFWPVTKIKICS